MAACAEGMSTKSTKIFRDLSPGLPGVSLLIRRSSCRDRSEDVCTVRMFVCVCVCVCVCVHVCVNTRRSSCMDRNEDVCITCV